MNTTMKIPYRVVDGVRQPYPTPWGALDEGDHVMLYIPENVRKQHMEARGDSALSEWETLYTTDSNVFILAEPSKLTVYPAVEKPDDPQDNLVTYALWGFLHNGDAYKYSGPNTPVIKSY